MTLESSGTQGSAPEVPGAVTEGQPQDSQSQPSEKPKAVDWTQDPKFREFQSSTQRRINEAVQRAEFAEREAKAREREAAQLRAAMEQLSTIDPESAELLLERAELERLRQFEADQRTEQQLQQQWQDWFQYHIDAAVAMGIDPYDPAYQQALRQADNALMEKTRLELALAKRENQQTPPAPDTPDEDIDRLREKAERGDYLASPPGGGVVSNADRLMEEFRTARQNIRQGDVAQLMALKQVYRQKGLDIE